MRGWEEISTHLGVYYTVNYYNHFLPHTTPKKVDVLACGIHLVVRWILDAFVNAKVIKGETSEQKIAQTAVWRASSFWYTFAGTFGPT